MPKHRYSHQRFPANTVLPWCRSSARRTAAMPTCFPPRMSMDSAKGETTPRKSHTKFTNWRRGRRSHTKGKPRQKSHRCGMENSPRTEATTSEHKQLDHAPTSEMLPHATTALLLLIIFDKLSMMTSCPSIIALRRCGETRRPHYRCEKKADNDHAPTRARTVDLSVISRTL